MLQILPSKRMEVHLKIIGTIFIILSFIHLFFPKYFHWKQQLAQLNLINRQMMKVHTFFIALIVFLMGILCLKNSTALVATGLGKTISLGLFIFWSARLMVQIFIYSPKLWLGKPFETTIHIIFLSLWIYASWIFLTIFYI